MDIEALKAQMKPLDLSGEVASSAIDIEYFKYYSIDFENEVPGIQHYHGAIVLDNSAEESQSISCHYYKQSRAAQTCFIVHGYMDHVGLFGQVIRYFLNRGCNVVAFDLPGHGLSSGEPASINSFGDYVLALQHVMDFFVEKAPKPWHIAGQSMGGAIVMDYLLSGQYTHSDCPFEKVALLNPLVRTAHSTIVRVQYLVARFFISRVKRIFRPSSHDDQFLDFIAKRDPLQVKHIPITWITALLNWQKHFAELAWSNLELLVVQGEGDGTVDWKYNLKMIREKFPKAKILRLKDARHHMAGESREYFIRFEQAADILFERRAKMRS